MNIKKLKEESTFYDFKSIKFKSNAEYNRELYAIGRYGNERFPLKLRLIESNLDVQSIFSKKEVDEIISELRYGTSTIVSRNFLGFKRYYVISKETLKKYNYPKEEYYTIRPNRK